MPRDRALALMQGYFAMSARKRGKPIGCRARCCLTQRNCNLMREGYLKRLARRLPADSGRGFALFKKPTCSDREAVCVARELNACACSDVSGDVIITRKFDVRVLVMLHVDVVDKSTELEL